MIWGWADTGWCYYIWSSTAWWRTVTSIMHSTCSLDTTFWHIQLSVTKKSRLQSSWVNVGPLRGICGPLQDCCVHVGMCGGVIEAPGRLTYDMPSLQKTFVIFSLCPLFALSPPVQWSLRRQPIHASTISHTKESLNIPVIIPLALTWWELFCSHSQSE